MLLCFRHSATLARGVKPASPFGANGARAFLASTSSPGLEPERRKPLFGTVPHYRSSIFLHTPEPPATYPARLDMPLWRTLQLRASKWGGIVNLCWLGYDYTAPHSVTAFSSLGGRLEIPEISLENIDEVEEKLRNHAEGSLEGVVDEEIHLYVCTHGARDCRCGSTGGDVVKTLREEINERTKHDPNGLVSRIKIGEVGHVGGHQFVTFQVLFPYECSNLS
jgi:Sucrase/ferredoxin-like